MTDSGTIQTPLVEDKVLTILHGHWTTVSNLRESERSGNEVSDEAKIEASNALTWAIVDAEKSLHHGIRVADGETVKFVERTSEQYAILESTMNEALATLKQLNQENRRIVEADEASAYSESSPEFPAPPLKLRLTIHESSRMLSRQPVLVQLVIPFRLD